MTIHQYTKAYVEKILDGKNLNGFCYVVYSTNSRYSGYCETRTLIMFKNERPVNRIIAKKRNDCIVVSLPINPGKKSKKIESAVNYALSKI